MPTSTSLRDGPNRNDRVRRSRTNAPLRPGANSKKQNNDSEPPKTRTATQSSSEIRPNKPSRTRSEQSRRQNRRGRPRAPQSTRLLSRLFQTGKVDDDDLTACRLDESAFAQ